MARFVSSPSTGQMALGPIRAAWEVTAATFEAARKTVNWVAGRGAPIVVDGGHVFFGGTGTQTRTMHYRGYVTADFSSIGIMVTAWIGSTDGDAGWPVEFLGQAWTVSSGPTIIQLADLNVVGNGEIDMEFDIVWEAKTHLSLYVSSIQIYEVPVILLNNSGCEPIDRGSLIYDGYDDRQSISGLQRAADEQVSTYFHRGALFNWSSSLTAIESQGVTTTSTTYQPLFEDGVEPCIQTRLMYSGETTRTVRCSVYARVTGGTGNVRITMTSGDVVTFNITNTTNAWQTTQDLDIETDDASGWDSIRGVRGATRDNITVEYRAGATFAIFLLAVSIWDEPGD